MEGGGGGVRVDLNEELEFFVKIQKKIGGGGGGVGLVGGQGGCVPKLEVFVKIKKKKFGGGGGVGGAGVRLKRGSGWM